MCNKIDCFSVKTIYFQCIIQLTVLGESYNFKKYNTSYYGQKYDLNSIMHYRKWDFSKNGRDTIQSKSDPSLALGNVFFTQRDLNAINAMYACPSNPTTGKLKPFIVLIVF